MRVHEDERAIRLCDVFDGMKGDVNLFALKPGSVSAWHRHKQQVDQFYVIEGNVRFGLWSDGATPDFYEPKNMEKVTVFPGTWHGYQNLGDTPALILMYLSHKYEDGWDEERRTLEEIPWAP